MAAIVRGETVLHVDGRDYKVRFTWAGLERVEETLGRSIGRISQTMTVDGLDVRACLALARAGLQESNPDLDARAVAGLFDKLGPLGQEQLLRVARVGLEYAWPAVEEGPPADPQSPPSS